MVYPHPIVYLILISAAILGAIVGSFLNVCIYRLPKQHISIVFPCSHCTFCGKEIAWYDNIPIFSWLCLGGACRHCRSPIRFRYPLVELLTSVCFEICTYFVLIEPTPMSVFVGLSLEERWIALIFAMYLTANLIIITFIDIDYRIIPNSLNYAGMLLAPLFSVMFPAMLRPLPLIENPHLSGFIASLLGILVGAGSLYLVAIIGKIIFQKDAMGLGDVKMMAMVGGFLGWDSVLFVFLLACVIGTVFGILWLALTRDHYIPFGPYLAVGTLTVLLFKSEISHVLFTLWPRFISQWIQPLPVVY